MLTLTALGLIKINYLISILGTTLIYCPTLLFVDVGYKGNPNKFSLIPVINCNSRQGSEPPLAFVSIPELESTW